MGWYTCQGVNAGGVEYHGLVQIVAGIASDTIKKDGQRLVGEWTIAGGDGAVYSEILTRIPGPMGPSPSDDEDGDLPTPPARPRPGHIAHG